MRQIRSKYAAKYAANTWQNSRQIHDKLATNSQKYAVKFRGTFFEILQNEFRGKSRGKLTNTL
jgi:hypothetical protein